MHFTYEKSIDKENLCQGDLLERSADLNNLIKSVHPHYLKDDYLYFTVVTQTCDLAKRNSDHCNARYITIAAVRSLTTALERQIKKHQRSSLDLKLNIISERERSKCEQFVERLLNNNEPEYFYYYGGPESFPQYELCAFLRLTIAVKADIHYDTLLEAKVLQLKDSFQHKLGSHVGHIYSRIGTEDWDPNTLNEADFRAKARKYIRTDGLDPLWIPTPVYDKVTKAILKLPPEQQTLDRLKKEIESLELSSEKKRADVLKLIQKAFEGVNCDENELTKALNRLANDGDFKREVK